MQQAVIAEPTAAEHAAKARLDMASNVLNSITASYAYVVLRT